MQEGNLPGSGNRSDWLSLRYDFGPNRSDVLDALDFSQMSQLQLDCMEAQASVALQRQAKLGGTARAATRQCG